MLLGASVKHKPVPRTGQFVTPLHLVTQILEIQSENLNLAYLFLGLHVVVLIFFHLDFLNTNQSLPNGKSIFSHILFTHFSGSFLLVNSVILIVVAA